MPAGDSPQVPPTAIGSLGVRSLTSPAPRAVHRSWSALGWRRSLYLLWWRCRTCRLSSAPDDFDTSGDSVESGFNQTDDVPSMSRVSVAVGGTHPGYGEGGMRWPGTRGRERVYQAAEPSAPPPLPRFSARGSDADPTEVLQSAPRAGSERVASPDPGASESGSANHHTPPRSVAPQSLVGSNHGSGRIDTSCPPTQNNELLIINY